jgi:hypothetical protein
LAASFLTCVDADSRASNSYVKQAGTETLTVSANAETEKTDIKHDKIALLTITTPSSIDHYRGPIEITPG